MNSFNDLSDKTRGLVDVNGVMAPEAFCKSETTCLGIVFPQYNKETLLEWDSAFAELLKKDGVMELYRSYPHDFTLVAALVALEERGNTPERRAKLLEILQRQNDRIILSSLFKASIWHKEQKK